MFFSGAIMAKLSKQTLQRLAVLRTLFLWKRGAFGPLRVHKTLFFAEDKHQSQRFFNFKRWEHGQFSEDIAESLNDLLNAGRITFVFDGPSVRLLPKTAPELRAAVERMFDDSFTAWTSALKETQEVIGYLANEQIVEQARRHTSYSTFSKGQIIATSTLEEMVEIDMDSDEAESLSEAVDPHITRILRSQMAKASTQPFQAEDWRAIYFADEEPAVK